MICYNPRCKYNFPLPKSLRKDISYVRVEASSGRVEEIERLFYKNSSGSTQFYLCECCHNAVELTLRK